MNSIEVVFSWLGIPVHEVFTDTFALHPQAFADMNNGYFAKFGVNPAVTGILVDNAKDKVSVQVSASINRLFPSVLPDLIISETGFAQIRAFTK